MGSVGTISLTFLLLGIRSGYCSLLCHRSTVYLCMLRSVCSVRSGILTPLLRGRTWGVRQFVGSIHSTPDICTDLTYLWRGSSQWRGSFTLFCLYRTHLTRTLSFRFAAWTTPTIQPSCCWTGLFCRNSSSPHSFGLWWWGVCADEVLLGVEWDFHHCHIRF